MDIPLSKIYVYGVISSLHPEWERLSEHDRRTKYAHGGDIIIATAEIGYGRNEIARLNGTIVKQFEDARPILNQKRIIIGFERYWRSTLNGSGYFTYQSTSMYHPFRTITASMDIMAP